MSGEATVRLFSYGTLQLENVQRETFGRLLAGSADALVGYARTMVEITDPQVLATSGKRFHPIVSETGDPADSVAGTVFAITQAELTPPTPTRCRTIAASLPGLPRVQMRGSM